MTDSITRDVIVSAPPARVWQAISDSREFGEWFNAELDAPFAEGAEIPGVVIDPTGKRWPFSLRVTELRPETLFAFEWPAHMPDEGAADDLPWTRVEFRLDPVGSGTKVTVTESGFDALPPDIAASALRRNTGGWEIQVENIARHVDG